MIVIWSIEHVNRRNVQLVRSTCRNCGRLSVRRSYDGTECLCIFWVPVSPTGRLHVVSECRLCGTSHAFNQRKWKQLLEKELRPAIEEYQSNLADPRLAMNAIKKTVEFQDQESFRAVAAVVEKSARTRETLASLGDGYSYFCMDGEATAAYNAALSIAGDARVREALALHLLNCGQVEEAREHVARCLQEDPERTYLARLVVEAYQALGRHEDAMSELDRLARTLPEFADGPIVERLRRRSTSTGALRASNPSPSLSLARPVPRRPSRPLELARSMLLPLMVLGIVVLIYLMASATTYGAYLAGGLSQSYTVRIADTVYEVPALGCRPISIPYGEVSIVPTEGGLPVEPIKLDREKRAWASLFGGRKFVVNPDRVALLLWTRAEYAVDPDDAGPPQFRLYFGQGSYSYPDVDYVMRELPEEISLVTEHRAEARESVELVGTESVEAAAAAIIHYEGTDRLRDYVRSRFALDGARERLLPYVGVLGEEGIAALEPHLSTRPVAVQIHRMYQELVGQYDPTRDLEDAYRELLEADPENRSLTYLLGRLLTDPEASLRLFEEAATPPNACAHAQYAIAYRELSAGDYKRALSHVGHALELRPDQTEFRALEEDILLASGDLATLVDRSEKRTKESPDDLDRATEYARLLIVQGRTKLADDEIERVSRRVLEEWSAEVRETVSENLKQHFDVVRAEARGDVEAHVKALRAQDGEDAEFRIAVLESRLEDAAEALEEKEGSNVITERLLLYFLASRSSNPPLAKAQLEMVLRDLERAGRTLRRLIPWLRGEKPAFERALYLGVPAAQKSVVLAALGERFPEDRERYRAAARRLNFEPVFPHAVLARALAPARARD